MPLLGVAHRTVNVGPLLTGEACDMYSVFQGWFGDNKYAGFQQYALVDAQLAAKVRNRSDAAPSRFV